MLYTQTHLPPDQGVVDRFSLNKTPTIKDNYDSSYNLYKHPKHEYMKSLAASSSVKSSKHPKTGLKQPKTAINPDYT